MLYLKAILVWMLLAVLAVLNGTFRIYVILPNTDEQTAHIISTVIGVFIQFIAIYLFIKSLKKKSATQMLQIGVFWVILTVLFEFIFGHYVMNHPWEKLLADYNIFAGRLWILVLLNVLLAPFLAFKIQKKNEVKNVK